MSESIQNVFFLRWQFDARVLACALNVCECFTCYECVRPAPGLPFVSLPVSSICVFFVTSPHFEADLHICGDSLQRSTLYKLC